MNTLTGVEAWEWHETCRLESGPTHSGVVLCHETIKQIDKTKSMESGSHNDHIHGLAYSGTNYRCGSGNSTLLIFLKCQILGFLKC